MDEQKPLWSRIVKCLKERRLPWRVEYFIRRHVVFRLSGNPNTKDFWNKKLAGMKGERWRDHVYFDLVELLPKDGKFSLLDIGCALGDGCLFLKGKFPDAVISGCDFSDQAIGLAKKKSTAIDFFALDILHREVPGIYDYITLVSILEHFDDPLAVIDKCLEKARIAVLISCPYAKSITYDIKDEHRFAFNEGTLSSYEHKYRVVPDKEEPGRARIIYSVTGKKYK